MTEWREKHEDELRDYFGRVFEGRMGKRSHMGGMLDALRLFATDTPRLVMARERAPAVEGEKGRPKAAWWRGDVEYIPVAPANQDSQRASREVSEDALAAVGHERRIRAALEQVGLAHAQALQAAYTPMPKGSLVSGLAAFVLGADELQELLERIYGPDREERKKAMARSKAAHTKGEVALGRAQDAYVLAMLDAQRAEREAPRRAFARSLGLAP